MIALIGCGLISSDVTQVSLRFPRHDFRIDTGDWAFLGGNQVPTVQCDQGCAESQQIFCGTASCTADCDQATSTCQVHVTIGLRNDYDLDTEAPEFQKIADQPVISVTIDTIYFDILENTLSVATPTLYVYMGPLSITAPGDTGAELVGIIDPVQPGQSGRINVRFEGRGQQVMKRFMDDFHTPFRVLVSGQTTVHAGEDLPVGRLVGSVQADAHAGL